MTRRFSKERIFYIVMTVLVATVIFYSSTIQTTAGEITGLNLASFYHFVVFFMFTFFLTLSLKSGKIDFKTASIIILLSLAYAISDEFHQLFVIGRFASAKDVLVDFVGSLFSLLVVKDTEFFNRR
jgi:VanZ family protein